MAEFERKELVKKRIHSELKAASSAILVLSVTTVLLSVIDVEVHYTSHGDQVPPSKPGNYDHHCKYTGNVSDYLSKTTELKQCSIIISTIIKCTI